MPPSALAATARAAGLGAVVDEAATPGDAVRSALRDPGPLVVAGSLYLVGSVRESLMRAGRIPDDGSLDPLPESRA